MSSSWRHELRKVIAANHRVHDVTIAELAKAEVYRVQAEARVKEAARITRQLQVSFEEWPDHTADNDLLALDMGRILEALRG